MNVVLVFWTPRGDRKVISREFNNQKHLDNFINYMYKKHKYIFDESFENN